MGNYHLHPQFANVIDTVPLLSLPIYSPEEIVSRIRGQLTKSTPSKEGVSIPSIETNTTSNIEKPELNSQSGGQLSQRERVVRLVIENRISMDFKLHTFTVLGSERAHVVMLFSNRNMFLPLHLILLPHSGYKNFCWFRPSTTDTNPKPQLDTVAQKCSQYRTKGLS